MYKNNFSSVLRVQVFSLNISLLISYISYGKLLSDGSACATTCGTGYLAVDKKTCLTACASDTYVRLYFNECVADCNKLFYQSIYIY